MFYQKDEINFSWVRESEFREEFMMLLLFNILVTVAIEEFLKVL